MFMLAYEGYECMRILMAPLLTTLNGLIQYIAGSAVNL